MTSVIPDLEWYKAQNPLKGSPHRCPFGAAEYCPKYAASAQLLVIQKIWDAPSPSTAKLEASVNIAKSTAIDDHPYVISSGSDNDQRHSYCNFCPEVLAKAFGIFVSHLSDHLSETDYRDYRQRLLLQGVDESHPHYRWRDYTPQHYTDCDRYSILYGQRTQIPTPKYDLRGSQFGGGFAETVEGNQAGGQIKN